MRNGLKRGLVLGLTICLAASSLAGCGKSKGLDTAAVAATLDGEEISAGLVNFLFRYQQAGFENSWGAFVKSYYGDDIWGADLTGNGEAYGVVFKEQIMDTLEKLLLAEQHMADYGVELSEEEKAAIADAAKAFIEANSEETQTAMSATQENVERVLTLYTIQTEVEEQMSADVDTEVSDEEAAQRTVSYVRFAQKPQTTEDEAVTEAETEGASTEAETSAEPETDAEDITERATEAQATEAAITEEDTAKTGAADTEAVTETETTEAAAEETDETADTETETTEEAETETETEDEATIASKAEARGRAEAFLESVKTVKSAEEFQTAADEVTANDSNSASNSYTFGADDSYPDAAIISATEGLEDNTLVDEVIEVNGAYYVVYVTDAFDEEATEEKKAEIVEDRKQDAINALYDEWKENAQFSIDEAVYAELLFDITFEAETEAVSEETTGTTETDADTEAAAETGTETVTEADTEAVTETATEKAAETETETEK